MIRLSYSDRAEQLAAALIANIEEGKSSGRRGALDPIDVIVPNPATASWLKLEIARATGIAANLRFERLDRFLTHLVERSGDSTSARRRRRVRVAGREIIQSAVLDALSDAELMSSDALAPVRGYIEARGAGARSALWGSAHEPDKAAGGGAPKTHDGDEDTADLRRFQLSRELARLFEDYRYTRREMLRGWPERAYFSGTPAEATERWQRAIYLFVAKALRVPAGAAELLSLPEAFEQIPVEEMGVPKEVHVFAVRVPSPVMLGMIARLARVSEVMIYALNPVREFWDDVEVGETPALRLWGRAGRESVRLLNELSEGDFEDRFSASPEGPSLLCTLQADILLRRPERTRVDPSQDFAGDASLRFLACPGARREIEAIAAELWSLMKSDPTLRFNEVAVALGGRDPDIYRAHIGAVFPETYGIPHHFLEVPLASTSRVVEAIELLLALPFSGFTRQELLRLILHPALAVHHGDVDPREWLRWLDALSVVHGADHADHAGTYIEKDLYNWDQGLRRLVLGIALAGERSGEQHLFGAGGQDYLPHEASLDRLGSVSRLVVLVRSLVADARFARTAQLTLVDWAEFIGQLVTSYVGRASDDDERDVQRCLAVIHDLARLDAGKKPVSFRIASELVRESLSGLTVNRGGALAEGVAVGSLASLSFLPFRVVFITGLGEGQFPGSDKRTQLDLRAGERKKGDVTPREEDQYLFLERLAATRERLYLSWVSREARTGDALEPSAIVLELLHLLERGYTSAPRIDRHPLRRFDEKYFQDLSAVVSPAAKSERGAQLLRADLLSRLDGGDGRVPALPRLRAEMNPEYYNALAKRLGLSPIPDAPLPGSAARDGVETIQVPYVALRWFLEDPCEGWTRYVLRMRETDRLEDPLAREDEAFTANALETTILLREIFAEKLKQGDGADFAELYDRRAELLELRGVLPTGVFGKAERAKHLATLEAWHRRYLELYGTGRPDAVNGGASPPAARPGSQPGLPRFADALRFGRARENTASEGGTIDPLVIEIELSSRRVRVEISGRTEPSIQADIGAASLIPIARDEPGKLLAEKHALRGFLDHVLYTALGRSSGTRHNVLVLYASGDSFRIGFDPFPRADAEGYLKTLLVDLLSEPHAYRLNFEEILAGELGKSERRSEGAPVYSSLPRMPPASAERAQNIRRRRFGLYFAVRTELEK